MLLRQTLDLSVRNRVQKWRDSRPKKKQRDDVSSPCLLVWVEGEGHIRVEMWAPVGVLKLVCEDSFVFGLFPDRGHFLISSKSLNKALFRVGAASSYKTFLAKLLHEAVYGFTTYGRCNRKEL